MVIGGFWWKARFIDSNGYIITGDQVQYNFATDEWVAYHSGEVKPYSCGACHTTGYKDEGNQKGKEGYVGTWALNGIQCEECHGPGELHAADPRNVAMRIDRSAEACGKCHVRGDVDKIPASGGFIKHHEQWNEMYTTKHRSLDCVDCHDPHVGLHPDNPDRAAAITSKCESCHYDEAQSFASSSLPHYDNQLDCIDCHMPKAAKSAVGDLSTHTGDIHSHLWRINIDPSAEMFTSDSAYANGYLTVEYTCLKAGCHVSKDKSWALTYANSVHAKQQQGAPEYVGSKTCEACHQTIYDSFMKTGHPFKLNDADSAQLPAGQYYPFTSVPKPADLSWNDISLVIGGFWWKARYINNDGQIYLGPDRQYNFATDAFVAYDGTTPGFKDYTCGACHTTGYNSTGHQDGKSGLIGTWAFNGIQCEECHGPGGNHILDANNVDMVIDRSSEACGRCHSRGDVGQIPASGGFVKHHEQWNEMFMTKHTALQCVDCHDPHVGLHPDNPDRASAIKVQCENCHFTEAQTFQNTPIDKHLTNPDGPGCTDCHMPLAAKSAVGDLATFTGDIHSHQWRITLDPNASMWNSDSTQANGYLTVDYTCLHCHTNKDKNWALSNAVNAHGATP
jgi:formate-dependent nitrite reductase cytochrome c552 subunit